MAITDVLYDQGGAVFNVKAYGAAGNGSDATTALQSAVAAAKAQGGTVVVPPGDYLFNAPLDLSDARNVTILGTGSGPALGINNGPTRLLYTGTASPAINLASAQGVTLANLRLEYNNTGFTGALVDTGHSAANSDPAYLLFDRCHLAGRGTSTASALIRLRQAIISAIQDCTFKNAQSAIRAPFDAYVNVLRVEGCTFVNTALAPILNAGQSWSILNCTFEPLAGGKAGAVDVEPSNTARYASGFVYQGNWHGDITTAGGTWVRVRALAGAISGNFFGTALGTGAAVSLLGGSQGCSVTGNRFETYYGVEFGEPYSLGISLEGNDFQATVPVRYPERAGRGAFFGNNGVSDRVNAGAAFLGSIPPDMAGGLTTGGVVLGVLNSPPPTGAAAYVANLGVPVGGMAGGSLGLWPRSDASIYETGLFGGQATVPSVRAGWSGTAPTAGFFGKAPVARPVLTYSRSLENAATQQIRGALAALGLVDDQTT
jgi:hypothetical protein